MVWIRDGFVSEIKIEILNHGLSVDFGDVLRAAPNDDKIPFALCDKAQ